MTERFASGGAGDFDVVIDQLCYTAEDAAIAADVFKGRVGRYLMTSTTATYDGEGIAPSRRVDGTDCFAEEDFRAEDHPADFGEQWRDFDYREAHYGEGKRQAEGELARRAAFPLLRVRCGHVLDPREDFTGRTSAYVDRVLRGQAIGVTDRPGRTSHVSPADLARFIFEAATRHEITGVVNAASSPAVDAVELTRLLAVSAGVEPRFEILPEGHAGLSPFAWNGDFAMDMSRARGMGYGFTDTRAWVPRLIVGPTAQFKEAPACST
jgi:hypothetical protein